MTLVRVLTKLDKRALEDSAKIIEIKAENLKSGVWIEKRELHTGIHPSCKKDYDRLIKLAMRLRAMASK